MAQKRELWFAMPGSVETRVNYLLWKAYQSLRTLSQPYRPSSWRAKIYPELRPIFWRSESGRLEGWKKSVVVWKRYVLRVFLAPPSTSAFPLMGLEKARMALLDDWRFNEDVILNSLQLLCFKVAHFSTSRPQNQFSGDLKCCPWGTIAPFDCCCLPQAQAWRNSTRLRGWTQSVSRFCLRLAGRFPPNPAFITWDALRASRAAGSLFTLSLDISCFVDLRACFSLGTAIWPRQTCTHTHTHPPFDKQFGVPQNASFGTFYRKHCVFSWLMMIDAECLMASNHLYGCFSN